MRYDEYRAHDATGLAGLVADGQVSAAELLALARERAAKVNPRINAIVREVPATPADDLTGPFAGVPFLIKDIAQDYAGLPTSQGSRALKSVPAAEHATVVARWIDAGLVIFGKTNLPEFGAKAISEPEAWGPARNPWNLDHTPGGSSGGSAAAVAAGIVPCAGANDGGGSTRIPAACCGLVGLKPGRGLTPMGPATGEAMHGAAVQGVVSRSVRDTAAMLDVIAGGEPAGPFGPALPSAPFASALTEAPAALRIGVRVPSAITPTPHAESYAAVDATVAALTDLGHHVDELTEAPYDDAALAREFLLTWFVYIAWEVAEAKRITGAGDDAFERDTLIMAALGRATSSVDYLDAVQRRHEHVRRLSTFFCSYDLLLTPTLATPPPRIGEFDLPVAMQRVRCADQDAHRPPPAVHENRRRPGRQEPRLGAVHPAGESHRATGYFAALALDRRWSAVGRAVRRAAGRRDDADPAGRPTGAGLAVVRPHRTAVERGHGTVAW